MGPTLGGGVKSLCQQCKPSSLTECLRRQRKRAAAGLFPGYSPQYKGWAIGPARTPTLHEIAATARMGLKGASSLHPAGSEMDGGVAGSGVWGERWTTQQVCARYGLK